MDRGQVMAVSREVAAGLDVAQDLYYAGQPHLCLAYLETVISPSLAHWYAACELLCQGIVLETPPCDCTARGEEQCYQVGVYDPETGEREEDLMYLLSTDVVTAFARADLGEFARLLRHARRQQCAYELLAVLFARAAQLAGAGQ